MGTTRIIKNNKIELEHYINNLTLISISEGILMKIIIQGVKNPLKQYALLLPKHKCAGAGTNLFMTNILPTWSP